VPAPSPSPISFDARPELGPELAAAVAVCDPSPAALQTEPVEELLFCGDGLKLGLRAIRTATREPIERAYLRLPTCAGPCTRPELSTGSLTAWTSSGPWTTDLDAVAGTATVPRPDDTASWLAIQAPIPEIARPRIADGPAELANRKPLPYCGHSELGEPAAVPRCFLAAVLAGRPAEAVDTSYGVEGGTILRVLRFGGFGPVLAWEQEVDSNGEHTGWNRYPAAIVLAPHGADWKLDLEPVS